MRYRINNVPFTEPETSINKVWTFIKLDGSLQLLCNGVEVFNFNLEESSADCKMAWTPDMIEVKFSSTDSTSDTASDF